MSLDAYSSARNRPLHISVVALPESILSPLIGLYEAFNVLRIYAPYYEAFPRSTRFQAEIVAPAPDLTSLTSGLPLRPHRTIAQVDHTDIIIVPSKTMRDDELVCGRYPELVEWIRRMHAAGAELCSACSGALLLAETGLWNGRAATIHWLFAPTFARNFPDVELRLREGLVVTGDRGELITSGASTSWHNVALFLVARHAGPSAAQALARFLLMQWHTDVQGPYVVFSPPTDHGDGVVRKLQDWLEDNYAIPATVEELVKQSGLPDHASHAFGLAVPAGIVSTTGIAGLMLGGGIGYLTRKHGLTIDNLIAADVVLADGTFVTASKTQHSDLLWALRGGGGNFGVVTSFLFRAHPVDMVYAGPIFWDQKHARTIMQWYRDFLPRAPLELGSFLGLKTVPSTAPFPKEIWGVRICALISCYNGSAEEALAAMKPIREELPPPLLDAWT